MTALHRRPRYRARLARISGPDVQISRQFPFRRATSKSSLPDHDSMNPRTLSAQFQAISAALGVFHRRNRGNSPVHNDGR